MTAAPRSRAGRPRDTDATERVLGATIRLLDERGVAGLRIDDVVRASGVAKTTIYRRWPSMTALVVSAMESALGPRTVVETGDVEADLVALVTMVHRSVTRTPFGRALPLVSVELLQHPDLAEQYRARVITPVRDRAIALVRAGIEQGILRPDTDPALVVDTVAAPLLFRRVLLQEDLALSDLLAVLEMVMRAVRA